MTYRIALSGPAFLGCISSRRRHSAGDVYVLLRIGSAKGPANGIALVSESSLTCFTVLVNCGDVTLENTLKHWNRDLRRNPKAARDWRERRKTVEAELARRHGEQ